MSFRQSADSRCQIQVDNERADAGRNDRTRLMSSDKQARMETVKMFFPYSAAKFSLFSCNWNPSRLMPSLLNVMGD